ncbi:terminase small subunit [Psychrobacillus sp. Sa2BUA9]|uniref:Terminase small subunit n=1 Tax=Psychrobacillus faecigallinarum TaxID=2762235 RepID=A0ABR8RAF3_9BACI|nr:terminase small subunit [Psychrobacillus faecigallinarum]MBD7944725.1 terminase small subunit [Psychrobacillus faecigallinarum]
MIENYVRAEEDYVNGMKYKDIAKKYNVSINTVKSWKTRHKWSKEVIEKVVHTKPKRVHTKKESAPKQKEVVESLEPFELEDDGFNDKQRLFISYYVKYWNATKAYQKAYGCSREVALTNGPRLLRDARIREEVVKVRDSLTEDALLDERTLIQKWIDIAFADITDYLKFGRQEEIEYQENGQPAIDMHGNIKTYAFNYVHLNESTEIDGSLITEVKQGKDGITVKLADKMKALEFLSKHKDLLNDNELKRLREEKTKADIAKTRSETKGTGTANISVVDFSNLSTEELRAIANFKR